MSVEGNRKQVRVPLTSEQIREVIAFKRLKKFREVEKFKKTKKYKVLNIFNILCVAVYCEMIFCMYGPAIYETAICSKASVADYGAIVDNKRTINFMTVWDQQGKSYKFYVGEYIQLPKPNSVFYIGKDFLLRKEIKVMICTSACDYRIWRTTPLVFLGIFISVITFLVFANNMNMINYSLIAISWLNGINLLYFVVI
jgi:hypothetical protein